MIEIEKITWMKNKKQKIKKSIINHKKIDFNKWMKKKKNNIMKINVIMKKINMII